MKLENDLGRDEIGRLVVRMAAPSMLAQFVSVLYSIVDRMYIGHIPGAGSLALAGVGVCGPVLTMIGSAAFWVAVGGAPLMSLRMGEGRDGEAGRILSTCLSLLLMFAAVLTAGGYILRGPMLRAFGVSDATYPYAEAYFSVYIAGTVFALLATGLNQFIVAQGFARVAMGLVILGAALNIVLDPIFIFILKMGVRGAALATVISQTASAVGAAIFLTGRSVPVRLKLGKPHADVALKVLVRGFSPFSIIALDNVMIIAMNAVLKAYGGPEQGDALITCATIAQSFMLVVTMPMGGISGGTQPVLAYNFGAMKMERVKRAQVLIMKLCAGYAAVLMLLSHIAGPLFVRLFTSDPPAAEPAFWAIRVCTLAIIPLGVQYEIVDGLTALGQVRLSFALSFWRKAVYFAALFLLPAIFGARAAFFAEPISDILGPIVSICVYRLTIDRILAGRMAMNHG